MGTLRAMVNNPFYESFDITFMGDEKVLVFGLLKRKFWEEYFFLFILKKGVLYYSILIFLCYICSHKLM